MACRWWLGAAAAAVLLGPVSALAAPDYNGRWEIEGDASKRVLILKQDGNKISGRAIWTNGATSFAVEGTVIPGGIKLKVFFDRTNALSDPDVTDAIWAAAVASRPDAKHPGMLPLTITASFSYLATTDELVGSRPRATIVHDNDKFKEVKEASVPTRLRTKMAIDSKIAAVDASVRP